jgi:isoquinoline 1-oxidoreductase beta subunit
VQQRNFHDYQMLRMNEMPVVEVHIVPSNEKMGGVGEPGVPPVAPQSATRFSPRQESGSGVCPSALKS